MTDRRRPAGRGLLVADRGRHVDTLDEEYVRTGVAKGLRPGETVSLSIRVSAELQPGPHRLVKTVEGPDDELTLYAPFDVLPPSAR